MKWDRILQILHAKLSSISNYKRFPRFQYELCVTNILKKITRKIRTNYAARFFPYHPCHFFSCSENTTSNVNHHIESHRLIDARSNLLLFFIIFNFLPHSPSYTFIQNKYNLFVKFDIIVGFVFAPKIRHLSKNHDFCLFSSFLWANNNSNARHSPLSVGTIGWCKEMEKARKETHALYIWTK